MPAQILALQMAIPYSLVTTTGVVEQIGWRAMLSVTRIVAKVQTTVFFGNDLYALSFPSNLDQQTIFKNFVMAYANRPETWVELQYIPNPPIPYPYQLQQVRPVAPPVSSGKIVALNAGFDPLRGYWIEFLGNYFLQFPIFQDWANLVVKDGVIRDGPNYTGFQASSNNSTPGGNNGSGGAGSGGGNCG